MPSQFEEEDFYRLNEVLSALAPEDRVKTGRDFYLNSVLPKKIATTNYKKGGKYGTSL
ncbi:hypothetical protein [Leuconostoc citreum]|uniref:hypothetical protein n=1 Tax=Leuconostoc citreum TaxID=33964 RepID=UPI0012BA3815|nr:hypothetical protein [Leuconostoc citreum]QGN59898.1 hypothetical protein GJ636_00080 [Leuconostoc citreum]